MKVSELYRRLGTLMQVDPTFGENELFAVVANDTGVDYQIHDMYQSYGGITLTLAVPEPTPSMPPSPEPGLWDGIAPATEAEMKALDPGDGE